MEQHNYPIDLIKCEMLIVFTVLAICDMWMFISGNLFTDRIKSISIWSVSTVCSLHHAFQHVLWFRFWFACCDCPKNWHLSFFSLMRTIDNGIWFCVWVIWRIIFGSIENVRMVIPFILPLISDILTFASIQRGPHNMCTQRFVALVLVHQIHQEILELFENDKGW